jgi:hypothetical protein
MREILHDMGDTQELAPSALERAGRGIVRAPFGDHVVVGRIRRGEPGRHEVRRRRVPRRVLAVHRVEQAVAHELGMKVETDEPALEPAVDRVREQGPDIQVDGRLVAAVEQVEKTARVVREAAPIGNVAHETHARPAGGVHVLVGWQQSARLREPHEVADLDHQAALLDRRRQRIGDLCMQRARAPQREQRDDDL